MTVYYGRVGKDLVFASELKALRAHPHFDNGINSAALGPLMARGFIPAPLTIYRGIHKLPPASVLTVAADWPTAALDAAPFEGAGGPLQIRHYWSYADTVLAGLAEPITDQDEALQALEGVLADAIRGQSVADVPVGAFLSGGIDSSTVVALYQKYSAQSVRTYSIGFEEAGYDEAGHAREVAARLGTVHHDQYVTAAEARDVIPMLPAIYDEPFADSSQIPTYLVSRFARHDVTVALTGDGGDELFGGYTRHAMLPALLRSARHVPGPMRAMAGKIAGAIPDGWWQTAGGLFPGSGSPQRGAKIARALRTAAAAREVDGAYARFVDDWAFEQAPVAGPVEAPTPGLVGPAVPDSIRVMYADAVSYLPDDILCKVDRASMAVSLETRVPFLDHRVAELAARIPAAMKIQGSKGKVILRKLLYREAPRELFERPKAGFAIPIGQWLKGPLRPWAEDLLEPKATQSEGWLDPAIVQARWREHLSGRRDSTSALWTVLMFQAWLREYG